jgi:pimeloyl-ACP methyl ester carboxylesterase
MPVLLIVGENDTSTPPPHQKILYKKLPGKKELHIIEGASHTFRDETQLNEIKEILNNWIKSNLLGLSRLLSSWRERSD